MTKLRKALFVSTSVGTPVLVATALMVFGLPNLKAMGQKSPARPPANIMASAAIAEQTPDGSEIRAAFKNAKTVSDLALANGHLQEQRKKLAQAQEVLSTLQQLALTECKDEQFIDAGNLRLVSQKASATEAVVDDIEKRLTKSFEKLAEGSPPPGVSVPYSARADLAGQMRLALDEFRKSKVEVNLTAQAISKIVLALPATAEATCHAGEIPPLFDNEREVRGE